MLTPKNTKEIVPFNPEDWPFDPPHHAIDRLARWKRKNRIKQLKRTIQKYKDGTMLPELSHLRIAYKWIQKLKEPKSDSPISAWQSYLNGIRGVRNMLNIACEEAAKQFGKALEKENRKEQS